MLQEPLSPDQTKKLCRRIINEGNVRFTRHAMRQMDGRDLSPMDCENVLRAGWPNEGEMEGLNWRYQLHTNTICVVVEFESEDLLTVVTAWRKN